ncbi:hypothetical protein ACFQO9_03850 [Chryseobacterium zhengzhouense]|uniref:TonB-dependent receptor n=1 Tax=Chryseobacterium zhengzhouense TaxID=1636086 RepID=A0ABW2LTG2_9FLAO
MRQLITILLFFVLGFLGKSQTLEINVKNEKGDDIDNINIQLIKDEKLLDFTKTNNGKAIFKNVASDIFRLKLTSVFYKTKFIEIDTRKKSTFHIILDSQITEIAEVEIKTRPKIAFLKNDTISFNVKAIKDGSERTTEDLIRKVPGLDINENGKVTFKGNTVGQVLVEGNDFFGKNHKLSTQNISADMIDGIDFFKNYTTMSGGSSTALNLKLKEEFRGKINGNVEGSYGTKKSYLFHTNLFKFGKSGNLAFIGDANSVAKNPINDVDFYEMNSQDDVESGTNIEVPSFLNNDGLVKSKENQLGALQYSKNTDKISVTAFSVFNNAQLKKQSSTQRIAFAGQPQDFNFFERKGESNRGYLGTSQIKVKKVFDDKSFLYFNSGYTPTEDNFDQSIERISSDSQFFNIRNNIINNRFNNSITWSKPVNSFDLKLSARTLNESYHENLEFSSDKNLFLSSSKNISQINTIKLNQYGFDIQVKNKNKWANFNFSSGIFYKRDDSDLSVIQTDNRENVRLNVNQYLNTLTLQRKFGTVDLSASLTSNIMDINTIQTSNFENNFKIKFSPKSKLNTEFEFEYKSKYREPDLKLLHYNTLYAKSLAFSQNISLAPEILNKTDTYKLTWSQFNMSKGNLTFILLSYDRLKPNFTTNFISYGAFSKVENRLGDFQDRWFLFFSNSQRITQNLMLKSKLMATVNNGNNFIDNNPNVSRNTSFEWSQKLISNFKNLPFQFDLGYSLNKSYFEQSYYNTKTSIHNTKFSLGLNSNIKKEWIGNLLGEYLIQKTSTNRINTFLLGGQVSYRKEKSLFEYNVLFNNILNLNSFNYINSFVGQSGTNEQSITALHGYIMGGLKVYF